MDYIKNYSLEGKVAWITGASYGIGFAIAKAMAGAGATIVFNDIRQELVDKGVAAYEAEGIKAHGYVCDVTDEDAVNATVAAIEKEVGVVDILVNNAGLGGGGRENPFKIDMDYVARIYSINGFRAFASMPAGCACNGEIRLWGAL